MSPNPPGFLEHLKIEGYHPRSNKHSNALAEAVVADLIQYCPKLAARAKAGHIVYDLNFTLISGTAEWNVDLVLGTAPLEMERTSTSVNIIRTRPASIQIAIEIKTVMTEHNKAVKNRKRDFDAHHAHVHQYNQATIAGGILVVNAAETFKSPLRDMDDLTIHKNPQKLVTHCIDEMRSIGTSSGSIGSSGIDAMTVLVVDYHYQNRCESRYLTTKPAPIMGDPLYYDNFIQTVCDLYMIRFPN